MRGWRKRHPLILFNIFSTHVEKMFSPRIAV
jgi:hypothetical protein